MSTERYLSTHQCEEVVFDDLAALNAELENDIYVSELLLFEEYDSVAPENFVGFVNQTPEGQVVFISKYDADGATAAYSGANVSVYGCVGPDTFQTIAKHITAGKLVLRLEAEGWPDEFFVLTPGKAEEKTATF